MSTQPTHTPDPNRPLSTNTTASTPSTSESWVDQCQSQFDTRHTDRLQNLIDDRNATRLDAAYRAAPPTAADH